MTPPASPRAPGQPIGPPARSHPNSINASNTQGGGGSRVRGLIGRNILQISLCSSPSLGVPTSGSATLRDASEKAGHPKGQLPKLQIVSRTSSPPGDLAHIHRLSPQMLCYYGLGQRRLINLNWKRNTEQQRRHRQPPRNVEIATATGTAADM